MALTAALLLFCTHAAQAQSAALKLCGGDARQHCTTTVPGGGRLLACLQAHEAQVSAPCKAALPTLTRCGAETQRWCGQGNAKETSECAQAKREQFSAACQNLIDR